MSELFQSVREMLAGKKTYAIVALLIAYQMLGYLHGGAIDWTSVGEAAGLATLRAGIAANGKTTAPPA